MLYADIVIGESYILNYIKAIGDDRDINNLTKGRAYQIVAKSIPDGIAIINDAGRRVILKSFRFIPVPPVEGNPFDELNALFGDDLEQVDPQPVPDIPPPRGVLGQHVAPEPVPEPDMGIQWVVGEKIRMLDRPIAWFKDTPRRNNPGFVADMGIGMDKWIGQIVTIKTLDVGHGNFIRIEEDNRQYSYAKEWFIHPHAIDNRAKEEEPAPKKVAVKVPKPKFKRGDVAVVDKKAGDNWIDDMDVTIGEIVVIAANGFGQFECDNGFTYVTEALRQPNEEEKKLAKAALLRKAQQDNIEVMKAKAGGVSSFCIFQDEHGQIVPHNTFAGICHAAIGYAQNVVGITDYLFTYVTQVNKGQHADYKAYVDYILNRSPWHIAYKKTSVDRALKEGVHMKVDTIPGKIIGAACVSLRMGREFAASRLPIFTMCVEAGYEEAVAYLVMHAFTAAGERLIQSDPTGAHTVLDTETTIGAVVNLMRFGYDEVVMKEDSYVKKSCYRGFTNQLSDQPNPLKDTRRFKDFIREAAPGAIVGKGFGKVTTHTEKDVFAMADALTKMFHKLDVME